MTGSRHSLRFSPGQTLLIDADDTLWENNIYFEKAIADFISHLDHHVHTPEEVRSHLNRIEHETIQAHGYGLKNFHRSLIRCFEQLTEGSISEQNDRQIECFVRSISDREIQLLPDVMATVADLFTRHKLILVTKGDTLEQTDKLNRSGLANYFQAVEVLAEKHRDAYAGLIGHHGIQSSSAWMIGNSPRSDINPALAAGLNAIFVPHPSTWVLEHELVNQPPSGQTLIEIDRFAELSAYF
jgi:putative hydrolase of the HAD superfamily